MVRICVLRTLLEGFEVIMMPIFTLDHTATNEYLMFRCVCD